VSDRTKRVFTTEFKERAVSRLEAGEQFSALAAELGVRRKLLYEWRKAWRRLGVEGLNRKRGPKPGGSRSAIRATDRDPPGFGPLAQAQARIAELERLVGRQQVDLDFFRRALRLTDADGPNATAPASTRSSQP
jgi:transposase-like protein